MSLRELIKPLALTAALVLIAFTPLRLFALIGCIILWAVYWPLPRIMNSWLVRIALAFILTTCFQQLTAAIFWIVKVDYSVPVVVILELAVYLGLLFFRGYSYQPQAIKLISREDLTALVVSLGSTLVILAFMLHGGSLLPQFVRQVTTGYDNIEHISLTQTIYDNQGYVYGPISKVMNKVVYSNLGSYPQGWSLSASIWWHGVTPTAHIQQHPTMVLGLYIAVFLLWYTLILFLFCRLLLALIEFIRKKPNDISIYFGSLAFTVLAEVVFLISVLYNGFASFLPSLLFSLGLAYMLLGLLNEPAKKASPLQFLISGLLMSGGISFSWLLMAPAGYVMVAAGLIAYFGGSLWMAVKWLFTNVSPLVATVLLVGLGAIQGVVQVLYGVKNLVNMPGGINDINSLLLFTFLLVAVAAMMYFKDTAVKNVFATVLGGSLLVSGAVYLYQFITSGTATYFSTKAGYVALLLIFLMGAAAILVLFSNLLARQVGHITNIIFVASVVAFVPIAVNLTLGTSPQLGIGSLNYLFGQRFMSEDSATKVSDLLANHRLNQGSFAMDKHLGFAEDVITTHFANMVSRKPSLDCQELQGTLSAQWMIEKKDVLDCAEGKPAYIIASNLTYQKLVDEYKDSPSVSIILSN